MANNPSTLPGYNGQVAAPDVNYTYGSARNDSAPGDLTGTPRIAAEINDIMGFQQKLLNEASIVPSGSPDTVLVSQYFQASTVVMGRVFATVAAMVAKPIIVGQKAFVLGNQTSGDGGSAFYIGIGPGSADEIGDHTCSNSNIAELQVDGAITRILQYGLSDGDDATAATKAAQAKLVARGGGCLLFDLKGFATLAVLTAAPPFVDFAIDVASGIELTAIPEFELRADKTKGTDDGGYCMFHILEDKSNIKIHGFKNINGIDKDTVKGIGQVVAIRGETGVTRATNIDIWDMTANEIRNEPFRLGQTSFAGQIGENVNIWDIRVDGCISHAVTMRSMLNSKASGLNIKNCGALGIDISSFCDNCHLDGGKGVNTFFNTNGGAKVDGGSNTIDCSISNYTYDGDTVSLTSFNAYAFRLMGVRAKAHDIYGTNCGGSGINMSNGGGVSTDDNMNMELENIEIDIVTDGGGGSSTFNGKPLLI